MITTNTPRTRTGPIKRPPDPVLLPRNVGHVPTPDNERAGAYRARYAHM
jgi:hypothetical protein